MGLTQAHGAQRQKEGTASKGIAAQAPGLVRERSKNSGTHIFSWLNICGTEGSTLNGHPINLYHIHSLLHLLTGLQLRSVSGAARRPCCSLHCQPPAFSRPSRCPNWSQRETPSLRATPLPFTHAYEAAVFSFLSTLPRDLSPESGPLSLFQWRLIRSVAKDELRYRVNSARIWPGPPSHWDISRCGRHSMIILPAWYHPTSPAQYDGPWGGWACLAPGIVFCGGNAGERGCHDRAAERQDGATTTDRGSWQLSRSRRTMPPSSGGAIVDTTGTLGSWRYFPSFFIAALGEQLCFGTSDASGPLAGKSFI